MEKKILNETIASLLLLCSWPLRHSTLYFALNYFEFLFRCFRVREKFLLLLLRMRLLLVLF